MPVAESNYDDYNPKREIIIDKNMNKLLERQIKKYLVGTDIPVDSIKEFIRAVNDTYDSAEHDQELMNRSLDISSREMVEYNKLQQKEIDANRQAISMLKSAVDTLDPGTLIKPSQSNDPAQEVIELAQFLSDLTVKYKQNMYELLIQKVRAENLTSELQMFKYAVDNAADFITFLDADKKIIYANKASLFNGNLKNVLGKTLEEAYESMGSSGIDKAFTDHIAKGDKTFTYEAPLHSTYGGEAVVQANVTVTNDAQNRMLIIVISRDITRDRALQREKDEFVSIASHELRTPMTIVRGYINLLSREQLGALNDEQKKILTKMSDSVVSLINFVAEMLDLSKLDAGKFEVNPVESSLTDLVTGSTERMRVLFDSKGVKLEGHIIPVQIKTDPVQFDRIMLNLLGNAYKFTPKDGAVTVSNMIDEKNHMVTICIADTGVGIPAPSLENLFKKFSQVDNVLQRQSGGSGLGLVISKGLVEKMGGTIWAKSVVNEGSQFYFTVPMA